MVDSHHLDGLEQVIIQVLLPMSPTLLQLLRNVRLQDLVGREVAHVAEIVPPFLPPVPFTLRPRRACSTRRKPAVVYEQPFLSGDGARGETPEYNLEDAERQTVELSLRRWSPDCGLGPEAAQARGGGGGNRFQSIRFSMEL